MRKRKLGRPKGSKNKPKAVRDLKFDMLPPKAKKRLREFSFDLMVVALLAMQLVGER